MPPQLSGVNVEYDSEPEDDGDIITPGMAVLHNMETPRSHKLLAIIERTAAFVAGRGGERELLIKARQADNPRFRFMTLGHRLNKFYHHMRKRIQFRLYRPTTVPRGPDPEPGGPGDAGGFVRRCPQPGVDAGPQQAKRSRYEDDLAEWHRVVFAGGGAERQSMSK